MRAGELTVLSDQTYDLVIHLSLCDISVDNPADPGVLGVRLKASKTDPFRKGMSFFIGKVVSGYPPGLRYAGLPVGQSPAGWSPV